jgi:hypothetical protein
VKSRLFLFLFLALAAVPANAQGCAQCRDNTAATPPSTRHAYQKAIALMTIAAGGIFVGAVAFMRRNP